MAASDVIGNILLSSVCGRKHWDMPYARTCIASWRRLQGVAGEFAMVDGGLDETSSGEMERAGFRVYGRREQAILDVLGNRPALLHMRENLVTWRHLIDSLVLGRDREYVLMVDTDVFVCQAVSFAAEDKDFVYNCDDVPGFRGRWYLPFARKMIPSLNPGFFLMRANAIDLDMLDGLVARYFIQSRKYWWTRQAALSVIVAASAKAGIFDGADVRVFSGNRKRTAEQTITNRFVHFGSNAPIDTEGEALPYVRDAAVLHLAGRGKQWLDLAARTNPPDRPVRVLHSLPVRLATAFDKVMIAARLALS